MKKQIMIFVFLIVVLCLTSCLFSERSDTSTSEEKGTMVPSIKMKHLVWIPIDKKRDLGNLFKSINAWVKEHDNKVRIISVEIINTTYGIYSTPSGALIVFGRKRLEPIF